MWISYHSVRRLFLVLFLIVNIGVHSFSQETGRIRIIDKTSGLPVFGANFLYGLQTGISGNDGEIFLQYSANDTLFISHLVYGRQTFTDKQLIAALQRGWLSLEEQVLSLLPVTVIAMHISGDKPEILGIGKQERLAHDAGSILATLPVIAGIRKSGSYGFDPVMRGFKYDQLNIVIDGVQSATAACPNRMDPPSSQVSPNMMESIEIIKGPHSMRYGNSFGGTINFRTTAPGFRDDIKPYGRISGSYESNGGIFRTEGYVGLVGQNVNLGIYGSFSEGNDYFDGDGVLVPAKFMRGSFGANMGIRLNDQQHVVFSATRNLARDTDFPALPMDLRKDDTWLLNARHEINFKQGQLKSLKTAIYGTFVDHWMDNFEKNLNPRMVNAETEAITRTFGGRTEGSWQTNRTRLYAGIDLKVERAEGTRKREFLMGPMTGNTLSDNVWQNGQIFRPGLFAEYQLTHSSFNFVFSGRIEYNIADISDNEPEFSGVYGETKSTHFNPGLSFGAVYNLTQEINFGLWLGRVQRSGSLTERFINYFPVGLDPYEMIGNPLLEPEINNQADLTFKYNSEHTVLDISLFASLLNDYISSEINDSLPPRMPASPGVKQYINLEKAFLSGFEISWGQQLFLGLQHQLSLAFTYGQDLSRSEPLPEIAPFDIRYVLSGNYLKNKLKPEISFRYVSAQNRVSTIYGENTSPSFNLLDIGISYQFLGRIGISGQVLNILDMAYYEHLSRSVRGSQSRPIYAPGRSFILTVALDFN